jgi:hypothetical protein
MKRLPVISREHFRKKLVPTTFINTYLVYQIPICKMESHILSLKKAIGISNTNWYFKYYPPRTTKTTTKWI